MGFSVGPVSKEDRMGLSRTKNLYCRVTLGAEVTRAGSRHTHTHTHTHTHVSTAFHGVLTTPRV